MDVEALMFPGQYRALHGICSRKPDTGEGLGEGRRLKGEGNGKPETRRQLCLLPLNFLLPFAFRPLPSFAFRRFLPGLVQLDVSLCRPVPAVLARHARDDSSIPGGRRKLGSCSGERVG
jgi:hypothetical protein